jgi:PTH1 family peptidyl-tRNA hydrolase
MAERCIIGLGNPGSKYAHTRHNVGQDFVLYLGQQWNIGLSRSDHQAQWGMGRILGQEVLLAIPTTYMNASGLAGASLVAYFGLLPSNILVVVDDFNLALGSHRFRSSGSAGGHNGLKSLIAELATEDFPRLRIGLGGPPAGTTVTDFVLGKLTAQERNTLHAKYQGLKEGVECWIEKGIEQTMARFNRHAA